jgi:hypothetical protein
MGSLPLCRLHIFELLGPIAAGGHPAGQLLYFTLQLGAPGALPIVPSCHMKSCDELLISANNIHPRVIFITT